MLIGIHKTNNFAARRFENDAVCGCTYGGRAASARQQTHFPKELTLLKTNHAAVISFDFDFALHDRHEGVGVVILLKNDIARAWRQNVAGENQFAKHQPIDLLEQRYALANQRQR